MTFAEKLGKFTATEIMEATGCPRGTAYDWKDGRRSPPEWQQHFWIEIITAATKSKAGKKKKTE